MEITLQQEKFDKGIERIRFFSLSGEENPEFFKRFQKKSFTEEFYPEIYHVSGRHDHLYVWNPDPYVDASYALALRHDGKVIVMSSFAIVKFDLEGRMVRSDSLNLSNDKDYPIVAQLEGGHFCAEYLRPLRWEKMLVTIVEDWARESGFEYCLGLPADKNRHVAFSPETHLRYDVTFKRRGYELWQGYWRKSLLNGNSR